MTEQSFAERCAPAASAISSAGLPESGDCAPGKAKEMRASEMITSYTFASTAFHPTPGELDEDHEDYINPGVFAKELAEFLISGLTREGYAIKQRVVEDWGNCIEIEHNGGYSLAVCCSNLENLGNGHSAHRVATDPDQPYVRKLLRKIDVRADVEKLSVSLRSIMASSDRITDLRNEE